MKTILSFPSFVNLLRFDQAMGDLENNPKDIDVETDK